MAVGAGALRPLFWMRSAKRDFLTFPAGVKDSLGFALYLAQTGQHPPNAKALKGFGGGVVELIEDHRGDAFRAVYTVRFRKAVYVLHAFKKKSKTGIKTAQSDVELIGRRLRDAEAEHVQLVKTEGKLMTKRRIEEGSDNIFADLGLPDAAGHLLKAEIVSEIYRLAKDRKLTQRAAGALMAISQPEVSRLFRGHFREYSIDRLIGFLTAFDRDVDILVRPHSRRGRKGKISFVREAA